VLPLYPAIAILTAGAVESKVLSRRPWLERGTVWWFIIPLIVSIFAVIAAIVIDRDLALPAWPFLAASVVCGMFAWQSYDDDGAERAFIRATAATLFLSIGIYAVIVPSLAPAFPSVMLAEVLKEAKCEHPLAASSGFEEPSLVFLAGTATKLTDTPGAADFLRQGECRFAFIDARQERAFALRAEAIGLRYDRGPRIDGFNISNGQPVTIAVFQSVSAP
jgi:hypothetical protein